MAVNKIFYKKVILKLVFNTSTSIDVSFQNWRID